MKKSATALLIATFWLSPAFATWTTAIPLGTSYYKLLINGTKAGTAHFSNTKKDNTYIFNGTVNLQLQGVSISTRQLSVETTEFKPVKLETVNIITKKDKSRHITKLRALFKDNMVFLNTNGTRYKIPIKKTFHLEGNYFLHKMIEKKFTPGVELSTKVYSPEYEIYKPITLYHKLVGIKQVTINKKQMKLFHVIESVERIKHVDIYLDTNGIVHKIKLSMLNNTIEYILTRYEPHDKNNKK